MEVTLAHRTLFVQLEQYKYSLIFLLASLFRIWVGNTLAPQFRFQLVSWITNLLRVLQDIIVQLVL